MKMARIEEWVAARLYRWFSRRRVERAQRKTAHYAEHGLPPARFGGRVMPSGAEIILCPFHREQTPSCMVEDDAFNCFGCGERGDLGKLTAKIGGAA